MFNLLLASDVTYDGPAQVANVVQHMVNPALALTSWALFGPAGSITHRTIAPAIAVPLAWTAATLVPGASIEWYPYTILDVPHLGYRPVTRNVLAVAGLSFLVAGALTGTDRGLGGLCGRIASLTSIARPTRRGSAAAGVHKADIDGASY